MRVERGGAEVAGMEYEGQVGGSVWIGLIGWGE